MSGWTTSSSSGSPVGPPVGWKAPDDTPGLSTGQLVRASWRLYRSAAGRLLTVAAVPAIIQGLLAMPGILLAGVMLRGMARVFEDLSRVRTDPLGFQAAVQAAVRPPADLSVLASVAGGIGVGVLLLEWAVLTAAALAITEGRTISVGEAFRTVGARGTAIVLPAFAVGIVWGCVNAAAVLLQPSFAASATPGQAAQGGLLGLLVGVLAIGTFVLAVYWSLALPAILAEGLSLHDGLARGAALTRGIRARIGVALMAVWVLQAAIVGIVAVSVALAAAISSGTLEAGGVGYTAVALVGTFLLAPLLPALLAIAYRDRTTAEEPPGRSDPG